MSRPSGGVAAGVDAVAVRDAAAASTLPVERPRQRRLPKLLSPKFVYALFDQGVVSVGNMVVAASVARHSPAAVFGMFILALRTLDALGQVAGVLIWGPYIFNVPAMEEGRRREYLGSAVLHQCAASAIGVVLLLLLGLASARHGSQTYGPLFLALVVPSIAIVFRDFTRRVYFAHLEFRDALITDAITVAIQVAGILWLVRTNSLTLTSALWVLAGGCTAISVFWFVTQRGRMKFSRTAFGSDFRLNLELGRWFFGSNMVLLGSAQVGPWLLSATSGPAAVAAFAVCESVVNIPRVALTSMQNAMGPIMARDFADGGRPGLRRTVGRMNVLLVAGSAIFAAGIMTAGPWVAHAIFHQSPANSRLILILLALNLVVYAASLAQSYGLSAMNLARYNFNPQVAGLVVQISLLAVLVRPMGVPGIALALLVSSVVVLAVRAGYYRREMGRA